MMAALDVYRPGLRDKVTARVPEKSLEVLEGTARPAWVSYEHDRLFVNSIVEELGYEGTIDCVRRTFVQHLDSALLRTVVRGAQHLFGRGPQALLRMLPRGWGLVYRDFADPKVDNLSDSMATLTLTNVHDAVFENPGYRACFEALFLGILDVTNSSGTVKMRQHPEREQIVFDLAWVVEQQRVAN